MNEKRFTYKVHENIGLTVFKDNEQIIEKWEVCNLLNKLSKENESLKTQNHRLKEGMLFFIHIASAKLEDRDTYCEMVFNCNYAEAKKEYGTLIKRLLEE